MRQKITITFPDGSQKTSERKVRDEGFVQTLVRNPSSIEKNKKKTIERHKKYKPNYEDEE